jgi:GxxExxY protein
MIYTEVCQQITGINELLIQTNLPMVNRDQKVLRADLLFPGLSYALVGSAFDVYNELGAGHLEKFYQHAYAVALTNKGINFKEQFYAPLFFQGKIIGRQFLDFLVEDKIVVEIKKGNHFSKSNIDQVNQYLISSKLQLAILINFGNEKVLTKRIININT